MICFPFARRAALLWLAGVTLAMAAMPNVTIAGTGAGTDMAIGETERFHLRLAADHATVRAGMTLRLAVELTPKPGWHSYWKNPADSGLPTSVRWQLPAAAKVSSARWPAPSAWVYEGMANYGYEGRHALLYTVQLPASLADPARIQAQVQWLACADICVPEKMDLALELPLASQPQPNHQALFQRAESALPVKLAETGQMHAATDVIQLAIAPQTAGFERFVPKKLFSEATNTVEHTAAQSIWMEGKALHFEIPRNRYFEALPERSTWVLSGIAADGHPQSYRFSADRSAAPLVRPQQALSTRIPAMVGEPTAATEPMAASLNKTRTDAYSGQGGMALLAACGLAFLGGLILNLMPCVLPVLSMKLMAIVQSQGSSLTTQRWHALSYVAGVVGSFLVLAVVLMGLRGAGNELGWGFQLQTPWFVASLVYLMLALGLSLSGVAVFGGSAMNIGQGLTQAPSMRGSFFTGALAVVVASPCSAPFMGSALGWALMQPAHWAIPVFLALGLGMALPMALVAARPRLSRWVPKPGLWMERFKQAMAFPLYLTAVWLLWVLSRQVSTDSLILLLFGVVSLGFALWLYGLLQQSELRAWGIAPALLGLVLALLPLSMLDSAELGNANPQQKNQQSSHTVPFDEQALAAYRQQGTPVFVDITAAWCITCQANERTVLKQARVQAAFQSAGVVQMVGDWTQRDATITRYLAQFDRSGVPLYVFYDAQGQSKVLPQLLTAETVLREIQGVAHRT